MSELHNSPEPIAYNYRVVRQFTLMTLVWGVLGMGLGVFIAAQLVWPQLNFDLPWTSFGRLRPIHTNLVIFAFGGGALFASSFYIVQRTSHARLISDRLAAVVFWGWQAACVAMPVSYALGYTTSKEYAEMEWPIALWVTLIWVLYAYLFFGTIARRRIRHIYVGNWFFGAFIIVTGMVHIINHALVPVSLLKSYSLYSGGHRCDGAMVVRAQRSGLHPLGRLSRDDVLLRTQTGGAADLLVPPVHRALLGDHLDLHLGRPAPPALHRAAGLGAEPGHGDVDHPAGTELGRHDQRHDDPVRRLA